MSQEQSALPSFNLYNESWIPVLWLNGLRSNVSLKGLFRNIRYIRRIASGSPTEDTAILCLAIVIFARALYADEDKFEQCESNIPRWIEDISSNSLGVEFVFEYLESYKDKFDLFDSTRPFMQVADLHTAKNDVKPISRLVLDSESEYFSMRAEKTLTSLTYAEAARKLLEVQMYDYSGIKSGAVGDPRVKGGKGYPIGVGWYGTTGKIIPHGENLLKTILYCLDYWQLFAQNDEDEYTFGYDLPVWERENPDTAAPRACVEYVASGGDPAKYKDEPGPISGMCETLTWQSRRIRLFPEDGQVTSVLVSNGDKWYDRYGPGSELNDPLTAYRYSKNQSSKTEDVWMPKTHSSERTLWRGVDALLARMPQPGSKEDKPAPVIHQISRGTLGKVGADIDIQLVGVTYGNQSAVIEGIIDEAFTLNASLLSDHGEEISKAVRAQIAATMEAAIALGQYAGNLLRAAGKEYEFRAEGTESVLHRMEHEFRQWLARLNASQKPEDAAISWQKTAVKVLEACADELAISAGPKAAVGTIIEEYVYNTAKARRDFQLRLRKILPSAYPQRHDN